MKTLLSSLIILVSTSAFAETYVINNDNGGVLVEYKQVASANIDKISKVEIRGMCASACIVWLFTEYNYDICITEGANIGLHKPYSITNISKEILYDWKYQMSSALAWQAMEISLPVKLQEVINKVYIPSVYNGDKPSDIAILDYNILKQIFKTCP